MKTFIRAAEIWTPTPDKSRLRFLDGFYGPLDQFREVSEQMTFGFDEGLPGKAWAKRHPVILKEFSNSYFMRTEAAKAAMYAMPGYEEVDYGHFGVGSGAAVPLEEFDLGRYDR